MKKIIAAVLLLLIPTTTIMLQTAPKNFDVWFEHILETEGGYVNHPRDPGGHTNKGITLDTYSDWLGYRASVEQLKSIPNRHVKAIYRENYWNKVRASELPSGLDVVVADAAVNKGVDKASRILQEILGVEVDGVIGSETIAETYRHKVSYLVYTYSEERLKFYRSLSTYNIFGYGWEKRVYRSAYLALSLI